MKKLAVVASLIAVTFLALSVVFHTQLVRSREENDKLRFREDTFCSIWSGDVERYIGDLHSNFRVIREKSTDWMRHYEHISQDFWLCRPELKSWLFAALEKCYLLDDVNCTVRQLTAASALAAVPSTFLR
jgi:hypothetical protein